MLSQLFLVLWQPADLRRALVDPDATIGALLVQLPHQPIQRPLQEPQEVAVESGESRSPTKRSIQGAKICHNHQPREPGADDDDVGAGVRLALARVAGLGHNCRHRAHLRHYRVRPLMLHPQPAPIPGAAHAPDVGKTLPELRDLASGVAEGPPDASRQDCNTLHTYEALRCF
jgi:hypothetical protein